MPFPDLCNLSPAKKELQVKVLWSSSLTVGLPPLENQIPFILITMSDFAIQKAFIKQFLGHWALTFIFLSPDTQLQMDFVKMWTEHWYKISGLFLWLWKPITGLQSFLTAPGSWIPSCPPSQIRPPVKCFSGTSLENRACPGAKYFTPDSWVDFTTNSRPGSSIKKAWKITINHFEVCE